MKGFISALVIVGVINLGVVRRVEAVPAAAPVLVIKGVEYLLIGITVVGGVAAGVYQSTSNKDTVILNTKTGETTSIDNSDEKIWKACLFKNKSQGFQPLTSTNSNNIRYSYAEALNTIEVNKKKGLLGYPTRKKCWDRPYEADPYVEVIDRIKYDLYP